MRIGVYVDGFNLYYGARGLCGRSTPGWRWLDLRALAADLAGGRSNWPAARIERIVYCTARIDGASNPSGHTDQDVYLKALVATGSVDHIEYGNVRLASEDGAAGGQRRTWPASAGGSGMAGNDPGWPRRTCRRSGVHGVVREP
jgi:hypothetical protein